MKIPEIETERLVLRGWSEADLDAYAGLLSDAEVTRFIGGVASRADAWRSLAFLAGHWELRGYGFWAAKRKADGHFIGRIGLLNPEGWPGLEVGWTLAKPFWGRGYATEAAIASLRFGFENSSEARLISLIHPENARSQQVAKRIGETRAETVTIAVGGRSQVVDVWAIERGKWLGHQH